MMSPDSVRAVALTIAVAAAGAGLLWWDASRGPSAPEPHQALSTAEAPPPAQPARPSSAPQRPSAPTRGIYRCKAGGQTIYQAEPCADAAQQASLFGGTVSVVDAPSPEQLARLQSLASPSDQQQAGSVTLIARSSDANDVEVHCKWLEQEIKHIDAMGRQPNTPQSMEWLREHRREVKDEMWRLKCGFGRP